MTCKRYFFGVMLITTVFFLIGGAANALAFFITCGSMPDNPIVNCGFETGDFTGWVTQDVPVPLVPVNVGVHGTVIPASFNLEATEGNHAAYHGFDG